jgi:hypothetical protein
MTPSFQTKRYDDRHHLDFIALHDAAAASFDALERY